jgi:hypothetical protein
MRNRNLGREHSDMVWAMGNLAITYKSVRNYADAKKLEMEDMRSRHFGADHPDTITSMSNLAIKFYNLQKYTDDEKIEVKVVCVWEKNLEGNIQKQSKKWYYFKQLDLILTQIHQELNHKKGSVLPTLESSQFTYSQY